MFGITPPPEAKLFDSEKRLVRFRTHWATLSKVLFQTIIMLFVLIMATIGIDAATNGGAPFVQTILWLIEWVVLFRLVYHLMTWWDDRVFITDQRFLRVWGILKITTDAMPRNKVTDVTYSRTLMGRLLGYGTLRIESAGQHQALEYINYVPNSEIVYRAMFEEAAS